MRMIPAVLLIWACTEGEAPEVETHPSEVETQDGLYSIHLTPSAEPYASGEGVELGMHLLADGEDVEGASVAVTPWMPDMGHGIDEAPEVTEDGMGMYTASWTFSMGGYWELELEIDGSEGSDRVTVGYEVE